MSNNSITLYFADKETTDYVRLVCTRKGINLADYIVDNFEWDDQLFCFADGVKKITSEVCEFCQYIESCPDAVQS